MQRKAKPSVLSAEDTNLSFCKNKKIRGAMSSFNQHWYCLLIWARSSGQAAAGPDRHRHPSTHTFPEADETPFDEFYVSFSRRIYFLNLESKCLLVCECWSCNDHKYHCNAYYAQCYAYFRIHTSYDIHL